MAWNQPGGNGSKDPWGGQGGGQQGPPDLDEVLKKLQAKMNGLFGGGKPGGTGGGGGGFSLGSLGAAGLGIIAAAVVAVWAFLGFYVVEPAEQGVVLRFGAYHKTALPGLNWRPLFVDNVEKVNVTLMRSEEIGYRDDASQGSVPNEALMLTQDENIIDIKFAVLYRVKDAAAYKFNAIDPTSALRAATESAVREIVGSSKMDFVLTGGRSEVAAKAETLIQEILDRYAVGLEIVSVNMQDAQPPKEVQSAFSDAVKAREDEQRYKNEARAYREDILPKARGEGNAIRERAEGYRQRVIALATGETSRFIQVLNEYEKAPDVTRERLYLESVESVLAKSSKVLVDVDSGNSLMYLPVDKLLGQRLSDDENAAVDSMAEDIPSPRPSSQDPRRTRITGRGRTQ